jgi:hypothetical protein
MDLDTDSSDIDMNMVFNEYSDTDWISKNRDTDMDIFWI